jgi:sodium-dependent dicarboxylate transporter 2/3/5
MFVHGVDRRIAYTGLSWRLVGSGPGRLLVVYGGITAAISMWMSNTATTAMMYPIGLSIAAHLARTGGQGARQFALAAMLMTSFSASIGGLGTPVGSPPNLIGIGMLERFAGVHVTFFQWMAIGVPALVLMFLFLSALFYLTGVRGVTLTEGSTALVREELKKLGPLTKGQRNVLIAFLTTVTLWVTPGILALLGFDQTAFGRAYAQAIPESVAAMLGAFLLFLLPIDRRAGRFTLSWNDALNIDWGIILLYGGGLAMGELAFSTGLAEAMGKGITSWIPAPGTVALTLAFTAMAIVLSEATSNTAAGNMIVPIAIAVAAAAGVRPIEPALGATLGASMGFMMPVSTPPNAIVYSSGYVPITAMMRFGVALDLVGFVVISGLVLVLCPIIF